MLRVSFLVLLAMALAATSAHARLDLFSQLLTSNNQLEPYPECQKIPFLLCDRVCDRCVCDRRAPQFAECTCAQWKPFGEELQKYSGVTNIRTHAEKLSTELEAVTKPVSKSVGGFIPYPECIEKCDECVICTFIYPIEAALCYCGKKTASHSKRPAIEYAEKLSTELEAVAKPVSKSVGGFIPYPECIEKCDECVICYQNLSQLRLPCAIVVKRLLPTPRDQQSNMQKNYLQNWT
ncbi:PREDICTED: uncharacterized protein LOC101311974 isoform X1 [Fragaria vesca subsp. vesca]|uniref:uncharacterized protein LOC101311974 isoform X1 n=1 Tax=Fragaria vesca subsp. vesca TaxID=101020 RepID=UPI0002C344FB|nr:PREDICTED: uncharacterized protein LOC101311974 isoform X1 [Fragaria vesca subsp. vesca]